MTRSPAGLVIFDNNKPSNEEIKSKVVEYEMRDGAFSLLGRGVGWLEDEDRLCNDEEAGGVEKWMCRKKD